jgi:hypothetical protein
VSIKTQNHDIYQVPKVPGQRHIEARCVEMAASLFRRIEGVPAEKQGASSYDEP